MPSELILIAIFFSLTNYNLTQPPQFEWFSNYANLFFKDTIFMKAVVNTFTMALVIGPFSYIGALMMAWALNELSKGRWPGAVLLY